MIELRNITKCYNGSFTALDAVNLTISDGEFVFIVGGSGAGKSTLTKLLIAEEKPTSGTLTVGDWALESIKRNKIPYYRRSLGIVFRDFRLFPQKTVYENVAFALRVIGEHAASIRMKVTAALSMVELSDKAKYYPHQLSGSQQQRVALARALVGSPDVIIADEPCGNVDPVEARELTELFCRIQSRYQKTVVVLTHDRELAESFGKRMICLERGKIAEEIAAYMPADELLAEAEAVAAEAESACSEAEMDQTVEFAPPEALPLPDLDSPTVVLPIAPIAPIPDPSAEDAQSTAELLADEMPVSDTPQEEFCEEEAPAEELGTATEEVQEPAAKEIAEVIPGVVPPEESAPAEDASAEQPMEEAPADNLSDEVTPAVEVPVEEASATKVPVDEISAEAPTAANEAEPTYIRPKETVEQTADGQVRTMTVSTDALEAVLADLLWEIQDQNASAQADRGDEREEEQG